MSALSAVLRKTTTGLVFWCPGCQEAHGISVNPGWTWDGNADAPTFSPSLLTTSGHYDSSFKPGDPCWCTYNRDHPDDPSSFECSRCHLFVKAGRIEFLNDCTHALAGQTVPLPPWPNHDEPTLAASATPPPSPEDKA